MALAKPAQTVDANGVTVMIAEGQPAPDLAWEAEPYRFLSWGSGKTIRCTVDASSTISDAEMAEVQSSLTALLGELTASEAYIPYPRAEIDGLIAKSVLLNAFNPAGHCVVAYLMEPPNFGFGAGVQSDLHCTASRELFE
ncbi:hypothetical protein [Citreimonas sp.]|uniref:hypothetical protein n=1 Tax=Citreimonas sp. TaxID=3036715 RepID=UPI0040583592